MNQAYTGDGFRVGVDIGGTFTDIVFISKQGKIFTKKVSSTTGDFTKAIIIGLQEVISEHGCIRFVCVKNLAFVVNGYPFESRP